MDYPIKAGDPNFLGEWEIVSRLGEGSQGVVYRAKSGIQNAAIKLLKSDLLDDSIAVTRFKNEAQALRKLNDPCVGKILDSNFTGGKIWIATEYINGPTLDEKVRLDKPLDELAFFQLASNLFHGLRAVHKNGVIHRDIKPSNIVMGEKGDTKLIDFGISHLSGSTRLGSSGDFEGSRPFSAPENYTNKNIPTMDIFSAASTLAYASSGKFVWKGENALQIMRSINDSDPDLSGLSEMQITYLKPMFAKNPSERPTAEECEKRALKILHALTSKKKINLKALAFKYQSIPKIRKRIFLFSGVLLSAIFIDTNTGGYFFWEVVFLLFPISMFAISVKTFRKGIGKNRWGKRNIIKSASTGIASLILLISLALISMASGIFIPSEIRSWFTVRDAVISSDLLQKVDVCNNYASTENYEAAIISCKEPAEYGNADAQYSFGSSLEKLGRNKEAEFWIVKAADQKLPEALSWMAFNELVKKNYSQAIVLGKKAANLGSVPGNSAVAIAYENLKQYDEAVIWYQKGWELGDILAAMNLGYHYQFYNVNRIEASKWLKISAETDSSYNGKTAFNYAEFLRVEIKNSIDSCLWYKKSADTKYKEDKSDGVVAFKKYCPNKVVPSPVKSALISSDKLTVSAPLDPNVKITNIFGRVFKDSEMMWRIILTNSSKEVVPPLTGIQFRLVGNEDAGWVSVPYKLKSDLNSNTVYAAVDDLFLTVLFKKSVCPEFRAVREQSGVIVNIWTKGLPGCSNDFVP